MTSSDICDLKNTYAKVFIFDDVSNTYCDREKKKRPTSLHLDADNVSAAKDRVDLVVLLGRVISAAISKNLRRKNLVYKKSSSSLLVVASFCFLLFASSCFFLFHFSSFFFSSSFSLLSSSFWNHLLESSHPHRGYRKSKGSLRWQHDEADDLQQ